MDFTSDDFLGGKIQLRQQKDGYRATSDAVLLAASVAAKTGDTILDVGCGTGAVALCVGARVKGVYLTGVEKNSDMANAAIQNAQINHLDFNVIVGDILDLKMGEQQFHHVVTNPPYFTETPKRKDAQTALAHQQSIPLMVWMDFCLKRVRARGTFTMIHQASRLPEILSILNARKGVGGVEVLPLYPYAGQDSKRIIVRAKVGVRTPFQLHFGVVLHKEGMCRDDKVERVMRDGELLF